MDQFHITGFGQYDGKFDFDASAFSIREWRWIKQLSGHDQDTVVEAYANREPEVLVAFAVIALCRDGKIDREQVLVVADEMIDTPLRGATLSLVPDQSEVVPPLPESTPQPNGHSTRSQNEKQPTNVQQLMRSGKSSESGSESSGSPLEPTGEPRLVTFST